MSDWKNAQYDQPKSWNEMQQEKLLREDPKGGAPLYLLPLGIVLAALSLAGLAYGLRGLFG